MSKDKKPAFDLGKLNTSEPKEVKELVNPNLDVHKPTVKGKRVNLNISSDQHQQLKEKAVREKLTISEVLRNAINEYLSK